MPAGDLTGRRILIVEDQLILATEIAVLLEQLGCEVVGPIPALDLALEVARTQALDGAILDINLDGEAVYPVADLLVSRRIPFVLATGYGSEALPPRFLNRPILEKPFNFDELGTLATRLWASSRP